MKAIATVVEVHGRTATVETERTSACEGCHKKETGENCSVCSLMGSGRKLRSKAENRVGAKVGDRVSVETATSRVLFYAALVFVLPLLLTAAGWFLAAAFTTETIWRILGAVAGFVLTFVGLRVYSGVVGRRRADAEITEILTPAGEPTGEDDPS